MLLFGTGLKVWIERKMKMKKDDDEIGRRRKKKKKRMV
jgi:hypothetical protein